MGGNSDVDRCRYSLPILYVLPNIWTFLELKYPDLHIFGSILRHCLSFVFRKSHTKYENHVMDSLDCQYFKCCTSGKFEVKNGVKTWIMLPKGVLYVQKLRHA